MGEKKNKDIAIAWVTKYIDIYGNGGPLHIVIGDDNYETEHIIWCVRNSIPELKDDNEYVFNMDVATALLRCKEKQRLKVLIEAWAIADKRDEVMAAMLSRDRY